jgi:hypothetical protein
MKKIVTASLIALSAATAGAVEISVSNTTDYSQSKSNTQSLGIGTTVGGFGLEAAYESAVRSHTSPERISVTASRRVFNAGPFQVSAKAGVAYLKTDADKTGHAYTAGVGVDLPLTKQVTATFDAQRQFARPEISEFTGNRYTVGVKYRF